jgi:tetratricopeptide (TPR) repeat protein
MINQGRESEALPWLQKAVEADADYSDAWVDLGRAKYSLGDRKGAIAAMLKAHEVADDYPLPLYNLAKIYDQPGNEQAKAIYYYQEFLSKAESYYETLLRGSERINFASKRLQVLTGGI